MKKRISLLFLLILFLPNVFAECETDSFTDRVISTCRIDNNSICDDGEHVGIDDDCNLDGTIFEQMWFVRLVLFITVILLFTDHPFGPMGVIIFFVLLLYNGAFPIPDITLSDPAPVINHHPLNIGAMLTPSNPLIGWSMIGLLVVYLFWRRKRKVYK